MGKIDKTKLARGTKLNTEHVWDNNLDGVIANINGANTTGASPSLEQPQYSSGNGTFRLTWNIPWFGSRWAKNNYTGESAVPYMIPFVLFPLQDFISSVGKTDEETPQVIMTEFTYGFDQRDEPALPADPLCGPGTSPAPAGGVPTNLPWDEFTRQDIGAFVTPIADYQGFFMNQNAGKLHYDIANRGDLGFQILKKDMEYFRPSQNYAYENNLPAQSIYNLTIPMAAFIGADVRLNPHSEKDLNIAMDPYQSYCLAIHPPRLDDPDQSAGTTQDNLALINLTISIKFTHKLINRDAIACPNIPEHQGAKTQDTLAVNKPVAGQQIEADAALGVNTTMTAIDSKFRDKLNSGYDASSNNPPVEQLCQDAAYEIIAIPMWNNQRTNQFTFRDAIASYGPYSPGGLQPGATMGPLGLTGTEPMVTRAFVPINYPFTIHHVVLAANVFNADFVPKATPLDHLVAGSTDYYNAWNDDSLTHSQYPQPGASALNPILKTTDSRPIHHIGVAIGTGLRGTNYNYKQICNYADLDLNLVSNTHLCLDKIKSFDYATYTNILTSDLAQGDPNVALFQFATIRNWNNWHLHYLPLNGQASAIAPGLFTQAGVKATPATQNLMQDPPYFCGESWVQRDAAVVPGAAPTIASYAGTSPRLINAVPANKQMGTDQWIEIRWSVHLEDQAGNLLNWNTVGTNALVPPAFGAANGDESKIIHGYGGHWIYIIGKKHVVSNSSWEDTNLKGGM